MELPQKLRSAIENDLLALPERKLTGLAAELSQSYRTGRPQNRGSYFRSQEDVAAYAVFRMPATFAAVSYVIGHIKERYPDWQPKSLLDVGAGPGTVMWAVSAEYPEIEQITLVEREDFMIALGKRLSGYSDTASVREAKWIKADIMEFHDPPVSDLVTASYVLNELPEDERPSFIKRLWEFTGELLVLIEPGTPAGFARIQEAREQLLAQGAQVAAPCPHGKACPLDDKDWCHFSQRLARTRLHRAVKEGELPYEDEKFSYLCMSRFEAKSINGIVLRHPQIRKGHIKVNLCTPEGLTSTVITRKAKELFRRARDLHWGSIL